MSETASGFLNERVDFLHVYAAPSVSGEGWDVVLRVDGTYFHRDLAEEAACGIRERLETLTDFREDRRDWWFGPPWLQGQRRGRTRARP